MGCLMVLIDTIKNYRPNLQFQNSKAKTQVFSVFRATRRLLDPPTPFRCDQAATITATPSPTEAVLVTLIASEEI